MVTFAMHQGNTREGEGEMITATIEIQVDKTHTYMRIWGEGIALEIAEELLEIARNMDTETLMGIKVIKKQSN